MIRAKVLLGLGLAASLLSGCTRDIPNELEFHRGEELTYAADVEFRIVEPAAAPRR